MAIQPVVFLVKLFKNDDDRARSQTALLWMLEALVKINCGFIRKYTPPMLYKADVVYERENGTEEWQDIPTTMERGYGDCEDLACWRVAELRCAGDRKARPYIRYQKRGELYTYHVLCQRGNGELEDPSRVLGMVNP